LKCTWTVLVPVHAALVNIDLQVRDGSSIEMAQAKVRLDPSHQLELKATIDISSTATRSRSGYRDSAFSFSFKERDYTVFTSASKSTGSSYFFSGLNAQGW